MYALLLKLYCINKSHNDHITDSVAQALAVESLTKYS